MNSSTSLLCSVVDNEICWIFYCYIPNMSGVWNRYLSLLYCIIDKQFLRLTLWFKQENWFIFSIPGHSDELLKHYSFIQESLYKLKGACCLFLTHKKHFVHGMYEAYIKTMDDVRNFFVANRLNTTAWRLSSRRNGSNIEEDFVSEFVSLRNVLDTKESKFIFR